MPNRSSQSLADRRKSDRDSDEAAGRLHNLVADPPPDGTASKSPHEQLRSSVQTMGDVVVALSEVRAFFRRLDVPDGENGNALANAFNNGVFEFWDQVLDMYEQRLGDAASSIEQWFKPAFEGEEVRS